MKSRVLHRGCLSNQTQALKASRSEFFSFFLRHFEQIFTNTAQYKIPVVGSEICDHFLMFAALVIEFNDNHFDK